MVKSGQQLWKIANDPMNATSPIINLTDEMNLVKYKAAEPQFEDFMNNVNVVLATFTTAHARLKLFSYMEGLGSRVLYTDTGSFLFFCPTSILYFQIR